MMEALETMMRKLPPPHGRNAGLAAVIGFLAGGIGLAIYFRNPVDLFFPMAIAIVASIVLGGVDAGVLAGAIVAALYGYFRVLIANETASAAGTRS